MDNIYTLNYMVQTQISKKKGNLYALFIDLKVAFNTIDHGILWEKLKDIGLSNKFIRIVYSLYSKANIKVTDGI